MRADELNGGVVDDGMRGGEDGMRGGEGIV